MRKAEARGRGRWQPHPLAGPASPLRRCVVRSPLGPLELIAAEGRLVEVSFCPEHTPTAVATDPLLTAAALELDAYFSDPSTGFGVPLAPRGSDYLQRVFAALRAIPVGSTQTYGSLARSVGGSPRSIGLACRMNPLPILIPCHRVVGRHGLVGYCGARGGTSLDIKRWLLAHEGVRLD